MKQKFYQKTWFKNTVLITIPTIISAIGVIISLKENMSEIDKNTLMIIIAVLMIVLLVAVLFFSGQDDKLYQEYEESLKRIDELKDVAAYLENEYKTSTIIISTFSQLFEKWSQNIYTFAQNVLNKKTISNKAWDKIEYFDTVCSQCKNMILKYCNITNNSQISVAFILCREDAGGQKYIHMVAHSDLKSLRPEACKKEERLEESKYHFAELIKDECSDIEVAVNNQEILRIFKRIGKDTDLSKYTQYIAIPVYCTNKKLLGIFQVDAKYNCIIEKDKIELHKFAEDKIIPYSNLIVLIDKISKGLYVAPDKIQREE